MGGVGAGLFEEDWADAELKENGLNEKKNASTRQRKIMLRIVSPGKYLEKKMGGRFRPPV
jgi:hypothetical protein